MAPETIQLLVSAQLDPHFDLVAVVVGDNATHGDLLGCDAHRGSDFPRDDLAHVPMAVDRPQVVDKDHRSAHGSIGSLNGLPGAARFSAQESVRDERIFGADRVSAQEFVHALRLAGLLGAARFSAQEPVRGERRRASSRPAAITSVALALYAGLAAGSWLALGQSPAGFPRYVAGSLEIAAGYSEAMSTAGWPPT